MISALQVELRLRVPANLRGVKLRVGSGGTPVSRHTMNGNVTVRRGGREPAGKRGSLDR